MANYVLDRRRMLAWLGVGVATPVLAGTASLPLRAADFRVTHTDAEWRRLLSPAAYNVLREEGTERAFTSPLNDEHRKGTFLCAGCNNEVYASETKFESGTGWPSFYQPHDSAAVGYSTDYKLGYPRREVHCADCGGHLGHVFDDGPRPTGKRHCINGVALKFRPA